MRLSTFERRVLAAITELGTDAYGATIHNRMGVLVSIGAVYVTLDELEEKGMIRTWLSPGGPERGGRDKRCCALTEAGIRVMEGK